MGDRYEGLQADCLDVIRRCNAIILAARQCRAAAECSDEGSVKEAMGRIKDEGERLHGRIGSTPPRGEPRPASLNRGRVSVWSRLPVTAGSTWTLR